MVPQWWLAARLRSSETRQGQAGQGRQGQAGQENQAREVKHLDQLRRFGGRRAKRPWEKTPLLIGGGAILAGAGGIYFAATQSRKAFNEGKTLNEIEKLQGTTNQLVIASAATLGVGVGVLTWGVILDGSGSPLPAVNFRF